MATPSSPFPFFTAGPAPPIHGDPHLTSHVYSPIPSHHHPLPPPSPSYHYAAAYPPPPPGFVPTPMYAPPFCFGAPPYSPHPSPFPFFGAPHWPPPAPDPPTPDHVPVHHNSSGCPIHSLHHHHFPPTSDHLLVQAAPQPTASPTARNRERRPSQSYASSTLLDPTYLTSASTSATPVSDSFFSGTPTSPILPTLPASRLTSGGAPAGRTALELHTQEVPCTPENSGGATFPIKKSGGACRPAMPDLRCQGRDLTKGNYTSNFETLSMVNASTNHRFVMEDDAAVQAVAEERVPAKDATLHRLQQQERDQIFDTIQGQLENLKSMVSQLANSLDKQSTHASKSEEPQHFLTVPVVGLFDPQVLGEMPKQYDYPNLSHRTVFLSDGTQHSYLALPEDYPLEAATEPVFDVPDDDTDGCANELVDVFAGTSEHQSLAYTESNESFQELGSEHLLKCFSKTHVICSSPVLATAHSRSAATSASRLSDMCAAAASSASLSSSPVDSSSIAFVAPQLFGDMPTPRSYPRKYSSPLHYYQEQGTPVQSSYVQSGSTNHSEQKLDGNPQPYGFSDLTRQSIIVADGTKHSYFALHADYPPKPAMDGTFSFANEKQSDTELLAVCSNYASDNAFNKEAMPQSPMFKSPELLQQKVNVLSIWLHTFDNSTKLQWDRGIAAALYMHTWLEMRAVTTLHNLLVSDLQGQFSVCNASYIWDPGTLLWYKFIWWLFTVRTNFEHNSNSTPKFNGRQGSLFL